MAIRLPMRPARQLLYTQITVYQTAPGHYEDGDWIEGGITSSVIAGSFQPPAPLTQDINVAGLAGLGERVMWTTADLPYYDIDQTVQCWIQREGLHWQLMKRQPWDPWVSRNLFVYGLERYHKTDEQPEP